MHRSETVFTSALSVDPLLEEEFVVHKIVIRVLRKLSSVAIFHHVLAQHLYRFNRVMKSGLLEGIKTFGIPQLSDI